MDNKKLKIPKKSPSTNKTVNYCDICCKNVIGSSYKFKSHLYQHKAVEPRFQCKFCSKDFFRSDAYNRHLRIHTGDYKKLYVCDFCDRSFVDKRNFIKHLKIHDEDTPSSKTFKCLDCDASYAEERCLKYHVRRSHCNLLPKTPVYDKKPLNETWVERVYDSNVCVELKKINNNVITIKTVKKENSPTFLKRYSKYLDTNTDTSQYSKAICDYCKKEMLKKSLRVHIVERHLKINKFNCETCGRGFKRQYLMTNHVCRVNGKRRTKKVNDGAIKS